MKPLRFGYGTNGFTNHRLGDCLDVLADLGYDGVALTLDHQHLDPFAPDLPSRTAEIARRLDRHRLAVVVETGARYLLDTRRKHEPTLVSESGRAQRVDFLCRSVDVAADLGAEAVSFWSGILPPDTPEASGWDRLLAGVETVLAHARTRGVVCALEPEPGMFVDTLAGVFELRRRLGAPDVLRVTLDLGHIVCNEPAGVADTIRLAGDLIANVQVDDMVPGVHEHLPLGAGDLDLVTALTTLVEIGYGGLAAVELPRHAHAAPALAQDSLAALRGALDLARHRARPAGVPAVARP